MKKKIEILKDYRGSLIMCEGDDWKEFVCCSGFDSATGTWLSGTHFESLDDAMDCFYGRMKRDRLEQLARVSVELLCDDCDQKVIDYLFEHTGITLNEARFLGLLKYL